MLVVARFQEIARFTALSAQFGKTALFIVYQIPSILPIAIPISALIASLLLFQNLSKTHELTALRAAGFSLPSLLSPLLFASVLLAIFNFSITAEIAPFCRRESKALFFHETSENPLLLLQRQKLVKIKHAYLDMNVQDESATRDLTLITYHENTSRLNLFSARKLSILDEELQGSHIAMISHLDSNSGFDPLIVENQENMSISAPLLSSALKKNYSPLHINGLSLKMLILSKKTQAAFIEILRRLSLSFAVFSFTLLGAAFGIEQGRNPSKKNLSLALFLTLAVMTSYLLGTKLKGHPLFAINAFFLPHLAVWLFSTLRLHQVARGRA